LTNNFKLPVCREDRVLLASYLTGTHNTQDFAAEMKISYGQISFKACGTLGNHTLLKLPNKTASQANKNSP